MATKSMADFSIHSPGCVQTCAEATHAQTTTKGTEATKTRSDDRPTDPHSTPPNRRCNTTTKMPPFNIAARAVAKAKPDAPRDDISRSEKTRLAATAIAAVMAGVRVSCSE